MRRETEVALSSLTTLGLGGPVDVLLTAETEPELVAAVLADDQATVIGGGSNLVIPDSGLRGTVIQIATQGIAVVGDGLEVAAGQDWDGFVAHAVAQGRSGVEALSGIPGLTGATPVQNVGAYGQDVSHTVIRVRAVDRRRAEVVELTARDCAFAYRTSLFKQQPARWVVLSVVFALERDALSAPVRYAELARAVGVELGDRAPISAVRSAVLRLRRGKGMVLDPADPDSRSAGSFFTNPVLDAGTVAALGERFGPVPGWPDGAGATKVSAAWLIERSGFAKGWGIGPVGLSSKHVLALVNRGGATTADLVLVARAVRDGVRERTGVTLLPEPVFAGGWTLDSGQPVPVAR